MHVSTRNWSLRLSLRIIIYILDFSFSVKNIFIFFWSYDSVYHHFRFDHQYVLISYTRIKKRIKLFTVSTVVVKETVKGPQTI
jgi:hypothetical protein